MRRLKLCLLVLGVLVSEVSFGQSVNDIYRISFKNRASGTARSASMGGAFTSLGADPSSMNINPAGIGMYRSSEVSFTPSLFMSRVNSNAIEENMNPLMTKKNKTSFTVNNVSAIFNIYNSETRTMRGFTLGVSYYNDRYSKFSSQAESGRSNISIGDYFAAQLAGVNPISIDNEGASDPLSVYRGTSVGLWGAIMGYNNMLLEEVAETSGKFDYMIHPLTLAGSDFVLPSQRVNQKTTIDNFSFSAGTNLGDIVYLGMTMGARMYEYSRESVYQEDGVKGNVGDFNQLRYLQSNTVSGNSFDFKLGATVEPVSGLKLGVAYHFPTISYMKDEYYGDMNNSYFNDKGGIDNYSQSTPYDPIEYDVKSAPSLLAGISYRLPFAILSFDYERTWYNKMDVRNMGQGTSDLNREIMDTYKPTDSFMAGVEVQPIKGFFVRGGYGFYGSALKHEDKKYGTTTNISFGLGYRSNFFYADLAYINSSYKNLPYKYFGGLFPDPADSSKDVFVASPSTIETKFSDSTVSLTLGFRF